MEENIAGVTQAVAGSGNNAQVSAATGGRETDSSPAAQNDSEEFEKLIKGKYKALYDARVQDTVRKRLKNTKAAEDTLNALAEKYGVTPQDIATLAKGERIATGGDATLAMTGEMGRLYPGFSMEREMANPQFARLVENGVDLRTAFEVVHRDQILPAAMRAAAKAVERKLTGAVSAVRPAESAMEGAATALLKTDVAAMSRADRAEIIRRVAKGEKIRF